MQLVSLISLHSCILDILSFPTIVERVHDLVYDLGKEIKTHKWLIPKSQGIEQYNTYTVQTVEEQTI